MKKPPFIKLYVKDFAFDTQELSNEELGAYMRTFLKSYKSGKISKKNTSESLFIELKNSLGSYSAVCERNQNNRVNSTASSDDSSTTRPPLVDDSVNQEPLTNNHEPITNKKVKRPHRIPDDWECSLELGEWAMEHGLSRECVCKEEEGFIDHWKQAVKGNTSLNWDLKFRTWIRNAKKWKDEK